MEKITLEDVLTQPVDVLLQKIKEPASISTSSKETKEPNSDLAEVEKTRVSQDIKDVQEERTPEEEVVDNTLVSQEVDLSMLKGYFSPGTTFIKGFIYNIGPYTIQILGLIPSANRVKFQVVETGTTHSMPLFTLTGSSNDFPYKKGDQVIYNGQTYEVKRVNPANNNVVLFVNDRYQYVKITKITRV